MSVVSRQEAIDARLNVPADVQQVSGVTGLTRCTYGVAASILTSLLAGHDSEASPHQPMCIQDG